MRPFIASLFVASSAMLAGCMGGSGGDAGASIVPGGLQSTDSAVRPVSASGAIDADELTLGLDGFQSRIYVANSGDDSIDVFRHVASGNEKPLRRIAGSKTGIVAPGQLAQDALGNLYVANGASILVFAPGADGNAAPIRTISGRPVFGVTAVTVDSQDQSIFAFEAESLGHGALIVHYASNANGEATPLGIAAPEAGRYVQVTSDSTNRDLIAAKGAECCNEFEADVATYPKNFAINPYAPIYEIQSIATSGIVDDPSRKSYLVSTGNGIERFAENTTGIGPAAPTSPSYTPPMESDITSDTTSGQLALGRARNIYAVHSTATSASAGGAIYVYRHDAYGSVQPLRVISGPATELNQPTGILIGM